MNAMRDRVAPLGVLPQLKFFTITSEGASDEG